MFFSLDDKTVTKTFYQNLSQGKNIYKKMYISIFVSI